jgi:hypothetical protein
LKHYTGFTLADNDQIQLAGCFQNPETVITISSGPIDDVPELFSISIKHVHNTIEAVKASQQNFKVTFCQITETFEPFYIHAMYNSH